MDKEYSRFIRGETNVLIIGDGFVLTRDKIPKRDLDYYVLKHEDIIITEWYGNLGERYTKKKSTGGKKPYVMLMTEKLNSLMQYGEVTVEQIGYLTLLTPHIEWNTGKLVHKRSKKSITQSDICELFGISEKTWYRRFRELQNNNLMSYDDGYYISTELFKKGGGKSENRKPDCKE